MKGSRAWIACHILAQPWGRLFFVCLLWFQHVCARARTHPHAHAQGNPRGHAMQRSVLQPCSGRCWPGHRGRAAGRRTAAGLVAQPVCAAGCSAQHNRSACELHPDIVLCRRGRDCTCSLFTCLAGTSSHDGVCRCTSVKALASGCLANALATSGLMLSRERSPK